MIYFDNNATTFMPASVKAQICSNLDQGNPSGDYPIAVKSATIIEQSRESLLAVCAANPQTHMVVFTSGASESNNYILRIVADTYSKRAATSNARATKPHFILSKIEHKTSILCVKHLVDCGAVTVTYVDPRSDGTISAESVLAAITESTALISVMSANNETGAINDIGGLVYAVRQKRPGVYIHCDCVQSFGKDPPNLARVSLDAISISFHKVYGPAGVGALILRRDSAERFGLCAMIAGTQNYGYRGGTENVALIAGGIAGIQYAMKGRVVKNNKLQELKIAFIGGLRKQMAVHVWNGAALQLTAGFNAVIIGDPARTLVNTIMFSIVHQHAGSPIMGVCNKKLKMALFADAKIVIALGSACNKKEASHVLTAMRMPQAVLGSVIRVSFGDTNTKKEVADFMMALNKILSKWGIKRGFDASA